jgi:4-amino-4-deoxy-L-arabinose transferase-like glycosyltransferase
VTGAVVLVAVVSAAVSLIGLGWTPFVDPPEGVHAQIAREMLADGHWITPRLNGVRYFDKPPLPYWLMAVAFTVADPTPAVARLSCAMAAIGVSVATAVLGGVLRGPRVALLAGLIASANLGLYVYGRVVKPDLPFVFCITLAWLGFALAWRGTHAWLALFYGALGLAAITKDVLGAIGPLAAVLLFLAWQHERPLRRWFPWWGLGILLALVVPWYVAVELQNRGFIWYTVVDNHLLNVARQRMFPDEDVPLGSLEFLSVTVAAFLPWSLVVPTGVVRASRGWDGGRGGRLWKLVALWTAGVVGVSALSPFKLPHYGLPAFPAAALLAAGVYDDAIERTGQARALAVSSLLIFTAIAAAFVVAASGAIPPGLEALTSVDVATRNLAARGEVAPAAPRAAWHAVFVAGAALFVVAAGMSGLAAWRRSARLAVFASIAAMIAFLPVAGAGMAEFGRSRSAAPVAEALARRVGTEDVVVHEGALENSGSVLLGLARPVRILNGLQSNLAYGATFPDARETFWDEARLLQEWQGGRRHFLVTATAPERSIVRRLPPGQVHLLARSAGHRLYANLAD